MTRVRDSKIILYLTPEQKAELETRARQAGLSVSNYLRALLDWPPERHGARKDLTPPGDPTWTENLIN